MLLTCVLVFASCSSAGEKAKGTYSGNYAIDSTSTYPVSGTVISGSINVTKVSDSKVNMLLVANSPSLTDASNDISVTLDGDVVSFNYSNPTTTEMDMMSLNGTISGNNITVNGVMYMSGGNGVGTFTGTK